ncbi:hypothetical protein [Streptomyces sp. NPDC096030]|uniref:hypothetical protein n=1 Tax=Streptomyces sp. NPDC096030 TaxID=3155423 RepID=UPI003332ED8B
MPGTYQPPAPPGYQRITGSDSIVRDAGGVGRLLQRALREARRSRCRYRVGAVLASGSRIISYSPNVPRNRPTIDFRHATFHAEEAALRRVKDAAGLTVYIARINAAGGSAMARPCSRCQQALLSAGVVRAFYSTNTSDVGCLFMRGC